MLNKKESIDFDLNEIFDKTPPIVEYRKIHFRKQVHSANGRIYRVRLLIDTPDYIDIPRATAVLQLIWEHIVKETVLPWPEKHPIKHLRKIQNFFQKEAQEYFYSTSYQFFYGLDED